jgi:hypothetical protein
VNCRSNRCVRTPRIDAGATTNRPSQGTLRTVPLGLDSGLIPVWVFMHSPFLCIQTPDGPLSVCLPWWISKKPFAAVTSKSISKRIVSYRTLSLPSLQRLQGVAVSSSECNPCHVICAPMHISRNAMIRIPPLTTGAGNFCNWFWAKQFKQCTFRQQTPSLRRAVRWVRWAGLTSLRFHHKLR